MDLGSLIYEAKLLFKDRDFQRAVQLYNQCVALERTRADLYSERGVCFFNLGENVKAIDSLDDALRLEPNNPYRYSSRAFVKGAMKDTQGAIEDYEMAIKLDPEDAISRNNLGLVQEQLGYIEKAKKNFAVADELAGILKDNGIITERKKESLDNMASASAEQDKRMISKEMLRVLSSKSRFKEFISFVKNGFKLPKN